MPKGPFPAALTIRQITINSNARKPTETHSYINAIATASYMSLGLIMHVFLPPGNNEQ